MDYKLDGITLNQLISTIYCSKCNNGIDRIEKMKEGTNLKEFSEISYSTGTTKILYCPKCLNEIKICIPNNEMFWEILHKAFNEDEK